MNIIKFLLEIIGWCQIAFGTTLIAVLIAAGIYFSWTNHTAKVIAVVIICVGFMLGSIWATIIWRKHGTIEWLSGIRRIT